jgi:hypothetical protein
MTAVAPHSTASPEFVSRPRSRRALLASAFGGLAAGVAAALGHPRAAEAAAGSALIIGSSTNNAGTSNTILTTNSSIVAFELIQNGGGTALMGYATPSTGPTRGAYGRSNSANGFGVQGRNAGAVGAGAAVQAIGFNNDGVQATCEWPSRDAVNAVHLAGGNAVRGNSADGIGVYAISVNGSGLLAQTQGPGWAGEFNGRAKIDSYFQMSAVGAPGNATAGTARLFARDNGGKTELCVIFPSGTLQVIKAEV